MLADKIVTFIILAISLTFYFVRRHWMNRAVKAERQVAKVEAKEQIHVIEEKAEGESKRRTAGDILLDFEKRYGTGKPDGRS